RRGARPAGSSARSPWTTTRHCCDLLVRGNDVFAVQPDGVRYWTKDICAPARSHDLHVQRVGGDLQELKLALPLRLALHRHIDAKHVDRLVTPEQTGRVGQHDHVVEFLHGRLDDIVVYVGSHGLQNLGRVTHKHRQTRGGTTGTPRALRPGNVPRYR